MQILEMETIELLTIVWMAGEPASEQEVQRLLDLLLQRGYVAHIDRAEGVDNLHIRRPGEPPHRPKGARKGAHRWFMFTPANVVAAGVLGAPSVEEGMSELQFLLADAADAAWDEVALIASPVAEAV